MKIYFAAGNSKLNRINLATALIWSGLKVITGGGVIMSVSRTDEKDAVNYRKGDAAMYVTLDEKDELVNIDNNQRLIVQREEK
ncbi:hypothetical protein QBG86_004387 [Salmonella enterica]|nr:hypothetical protein [Salmonella enterica]EKS2298570.1 hypothetical protein [Salmonella enterica]EKS2420488.1 hypothetical protein [Salmonella enterica]